MNQIPEIVYELIKLIEASTFLSDRQKETLTGKVETLPPAMQLKLKETFTKEQKTLLEHYKNVSRIHKKSAEKKIKVIYNYAERMVKKVEANELESLEQELAELEQ